MEDPSFGGRYHGQHKDMSFTMSQLATHRMIMKIMMTAVNSLFAHFILKHRIVTLASEFYNLDAPTYTFFSLKISTQNWVCCMQNVSHEATTWHVN